MTNFELLDRYLLDGQPAKADVVRLLLENRSELPAAVPFYEGMRMLGPRTPDLTLVALRLVLVGRKADDSTVTALRTLSERARAAGSGDTVERRAYLEAAGAL